MFYIDNSFQYSGGLPPFDSLIQPYLNYGYKSQNASLDDLINAYCFKEQFAIELKWLFSPPRGMIPIAGSIGVNSL